MPPPRFTCGALVLLLLFAFGAPAAFGQSGPPAPSSVPAKTAPSSTAPPTAAPAPGGPAVTTHAAGAAGTSTAATAATGDKAMAAQKYEEGAALAKEGRWKDAYPLFVEAWGHLHHWQIAVSLGRVEIEVGQFRAAEHHLTFALDDAGLPAGDRAEAERLLAVARASLGTLRIVATAQAAARVFLDDQRIGTTPLTTTITVNPGEHKLELRFGTSRQTRTIPVKTGKSQAVNIDLRLPELDKPLPTEPWVGAADAGATGGHGNAGVGDGEASGPAAVLGPNWVGVVTLGGLALVGAGLGGGLWVVAEGKSTQANVTLALSGITSNADCKSGHNRAICDRSEGLLKDHDAFKTGAVAAWIGGGVAAVGAVTLWAVTRKDGSKTGVRVVPVVASQQAGVLFQGSW